MHKLFDAIYKNDEKTIRAMVKQGYSMNTIFDDTDDGKTPLMTATELNNTDMISLILELGADISQVTISRGDTALTWCSKFGSPLTFKEIAFVLEEKGKFDINFQNAEGASPLILAGNYGFTEMIECILEYHPDLFIKDIDGKDVFEITSNDFVVDRSQTREILAKALTQHTLKKHRL